MDQEKGNDLFHNNERGDIYDLYNVCNGVLHNGSLDIRKLNELGPDEAEFLDILWLKEVWRHTTTGCVKCEDIIKRLNLVRGKGKGDGGKIVRTGTFSRAQ